MIKELACYFLSSQNHRMFLFYSQPPLNGEIIPFFPPPVSTRTFVVAASVQADLERLHDTCFYR